MAGGTDGSSGTDAAIVRPSWDDPDVFAVPFDRYADDVHRHADDVHRHAERRLGTEAADDLMAETFATAFRQRRRYDLSRPHARPWLYGVVTDLVTDLVGGHRRAEDRRPRILARAAPPPRGRTRTGTARTGRGS